MLSNEYKAVRESLSKKKRESFGGEIPKLEIADREKQRLISAGWKFLSASDVKLGYGLDSNNESAFVLEIKHSSSGDVDDELIGILYKSEDDRSKYELQIDDAEGVAAYVFPKAISIDKIMLLTPEFKNSRNFQDLDRLGGVRL